MTSQRPNFASSGESATWSAELGHPQLCDTNSRGFTAEYSPTYLAAPDQGPDCGLWPQRDWRTDGSPETTWRPESGLWCPSGDLLTPTQDGYSYPNYPSSDPYNNSDGHGSPYGEGQYDGSTERPDDVTTWSQATMHQAIASIEVGNQINQNSFAETCNTHSPYPAHRDSYTSYDSYGSPNVGTPQSPYDASDAGTASPISVPLKKQAKTEGRRRKVKLYQLEPQADPQLEKQRLRALRQHERRLQQEQYERNLNKEFNAKTTEVTALRHEKHALMDNIESMQQKMVQLSMAQRRGDIGPRGTAARESLGTPQPSVQQSTSNWSC